MFPRLLHAAALQLLRSHTTGRVEECALNLRDAMTNAAYYLQDSDLWTQSSCYDRAFASPLRQDRDDCAQTALDAFLRCLEQAAVA